MSDHKAELAEVKMNLDYWLSQRDTANFTIRYLETRVKTLNEIIFLEDNAHNIIANRQEQLALMRSAFEWLNSDQDPDAIVDHLGLYCEKAFSFCELDYVKINVVPASSYGYPVFVFEPKFQKLNECALTYCDKLVMEFCPVHESWNGINNGQWLATYSISPAMSLSAGMMKARRNYSEFFDNFQYGTDFKRRCALLVKPQGWR